MKCDDSLVYDLCYMEYFMKGIGIGYSRFFIRVICIRGSFLVFLGFILIFRSLSGLFGFRVGILGFCRLRLISGSGAWFFPLSSYRSDHPYLLSSLRILLTEISTSLYSPYFAHQVIAEPPPNN